MRVLLIKIVLLFFAALPLTITHRIASGLGHWFLWRRSALYRITEINIQLCYLQLDERQQFILIRQSLVETCKTFSELGALWLWPPAKVLKLLRQVSNEQLVWQGIARKKGVILLTPHLGAWEMAGLYATLYFSPMTVLYRPPKLQGLHQLILQARQRAGGKYVATDQSGIRELYRALQRGEVIGILPDQVPPHANAGVFAPFFDRMAHTMILVARLAQKTDATVILTYAERLPKSEGFHLYFVPVAKAVASEDLTQAARVLNQAIENCIQTCPQQYQWSYKRFKMPFPGETQNIYDQQKII